MEVLLLTDAYCLITEISIILLKRLMWHRGGQAAPQEIKDTHAVSADKPVYVNSAITVKQMHRAVMSLKDGKAPDTMIGGWFKTLATYISTIFIFCFNFLSDGGNVLTVGRGSGSQKYSGQLHRDITLTHIL